MTPDPLLSSSNASFVPSALKTIVLSLSVFRVQTTCPRVVRSIYDEGTADFCEGDHLSMTHLAGDLTVSTKEYG
jgi:hypothetical protein